MESLDVPIPPVPDGHVQQVISAIEMGAGDRVEVVKDVHVRGAGQDGAEVTLDLRGSSGVVVSRDHRSRRVVVRLLTKPPLLEAFREDELRVVELAPELGDRTRG